jgi:ParB family chromosome partitioning protein
VSGRDGADAGEPIAIWIAVDALQPNPDQPRKFFDAAKLEQLTASVRAKGRIVTPLVARPLPEGGYEIVCGERRWRAAKAAELTEVPVVVRKLSDQEAFEESLLENLDREDMAPLDEVRAIARLAAEHGVQEAARRLGRPHHWISKRKRIAEAPALVLEFLERGDTTDIEALYELAKLAETDAAAAETVITNHGTAGHLREEVKSAAREARAEAADEEKGPERRRAEGFGEEEPRLSDRGFGGAGGSGGEDEDEEDEEDGDQGSDTDESSEEGSEKPERPWLPSDAPELDEPFDADPALFVTSVEARRAGHLVFMTANGATTYELSEEARQQLLALLGVGS